MLCSAIFSCILLTVVAADPVRHSEPELPDEWQKASELSESHLVTLRFSLRQQNLDKVKQIAISVSDPKNAKYGQYMTGAEVNSLTAPLAEHVQAVEHWLQKHSLSFSKVAGGQVIEVELTSTAAANLLRTKFHHAVNSRTKQAAVRAGDFFLPSEVNDAVAAVYGMHGLPLPPRIALESPPKPGKPANVNPAVLEKTYNVSGVTPSGSAKNRQAVAEFQGQTMKPSDLAKFFKQFVPDSKADSIHKFVGDNGTGIAGVEASLDVDYIMGVAPGLLTEFWYWKGQDFCGDLANWTSTIISTAQPPLVHSVSYGWQGNLTQIGCKESDVKDVDSNFAKLATMGITIIFASGDSGSGYNPESICQDPSKYKKDMAVDGTPDQTFPVPSAQACCVESSFRAKNSTSWTFTPGSPNSTKGPDNKGQCKVFSQQSPKTIAAKGSISGGSAFGAKPKLWPSWPASSPWVTSVGATRFIDQTVGHGEMASDQFGSGGGFSTMFDAFKEQKDAVAHYLKVAKNLPPQGSFPPGGRATPDVSTLGEGFQVVDNGNVSPVGGTSASAPTFAGFVSLLNEARIKAGKPAMGYLNPFLYQNPDAFRDVTVGTNAIGRGTGPIKYGFACAPGWDPATGLGTPNFEKLLSKAMADSSASLFI